MPRETIRVFADLEISVQFHLRQREVAVPTDGRARNSGVPEQYLPAMRLEAKQVQNTVRCCRVGMIAPCRVRGWATSCLSANRKREVVFTRLTPEDVYCHCEDSARSVRRLRHTQM